jgi:uncharacterized membrane protein
VVVIGWTSLKQEIITNLQSTETMYRQQQEEYLPGWGGMLPMPLKVGQMIVESALADGCGQLFHRADTAIDDACGWIMVHCEVISAKPVIAVFVIVGSLCGAFSFVILYYLLGICGAAAGGVYGVVKVTESNVTATKN